MADPSPPRTPPRSTAPTDLATRSDVHDLVVQFYREIVFDELLEPVFGEVAEVDWADHIPKLVDYWCRVLLGQPGYDGRFLDAHRHVHEQEAFRREHFDRWYGLWESSIDAGWHGPLADQAKRHAVRMADTLSRKLVGEGWEPERPGGTDAMPLMAESSAVPRPLLALVPHHEE